MNQVTVIIWSCVTVGVLLGICAIVLAVISAKNMKKNREAMRKLQEGIKVGARILFAGGIYGKIVRINNDLIDVEINKSTVIQISRYSIQDVITGCFLHKTIREISRPFRVLAQRLETRRISPGTVLRF